MPLPQGSRREPTRRHGGRRISIAELRRQLGRPTGLDDSARQRLLDLAQRLSRLKALGEGIGRVQLSPLASAALETKASCV